VTDVMEELEGGLPREGHRAEDGSPGAVVLGSGDYRFQVSGENWGDKPADWVYREATAVAIDAKDRVWVFNRGTKPMIVFDADGTMVDTWDWEQGDGFNNPHGVTVAPDGTIWCVDNGNNTIKHFTAGGELLLTLGEADQPTPKMSGQPFSVPCHVGVDPRSGEFYVADGYSNARVHKYSPEGRYLFSWGESGTDEGQFNIVHNVKVGRDGWVYVADRENHRVQIFSSDGKFETQWVNLSRAAALDIDMSGERDVIYVGEYFSGIASNDIGTGLGPRVTVMSADGKVLSRVGTEAYGSQVGRFFSPHGVAVDSRGDLYVAEVANTDYGVPWRVKQELRSLQKLVRVHAG
jgi:DNA-binding beta-propeller fold protein YncE